VPLRLRSSGGEREKSGECDGGTHGA
jgi:hypothetical protein